MNPPFTPVQKPRFFFPDALRAFASLWVIFQHLFIDNHIPQLFAIMPVLMRKIVFEYGNLGVSIFFVMSGFFIAQSLQTTRITWTTFPKLLLKRGLRLSPAYYVAIAWAIACATGVSMVLGRVQTGWTIQDVLVHGLYLQGLIPVGVINEVFWTLCIEMQFFCAFCVLLALVQYVETRWQWKQSRNVIFLIVGLVALLYPMKFIDRMIPFNNGFFPFWYACTLGVFANWTWQESFNRRIFYGYAGCTVIATILARQFFPGICLITAVSLLEVARSGQTLRFMNWQWLQSVGIVSYMLYLLHEPLLKVLFPLEHHWFGNSIGVDLLGLLINLPLCYGIAALGYYWIEKPSLTWIKQFKFLKLT
jgi:peptidoglycan/LPS O-acetylase OafA/YrhL